MVDVDESLGREVKRASAQTPPCFVVLIPDIKVFSSDFAFNVQSLIVSHNA